MIRATVLGVVLLLSLPGILWAGPAELRCVELGESCVASEPMNTNNYQVNCSGQADIDFADSEGPGSKEMTRAYTRCDRQSAVSTSVSDVGLPSGTSQIDWVMRVDPDGANNVAHAGSSVPSGNRRLCQRVYRKFSPNYRGFIGCGANKQQEFWSSQSTIIQLSDGRGTTGSIGLWAGAMTWGGSWLPSSGSISHTDCDNNWCRQEICISSGQDIRDLRNVSLEGYITQVGVPNPKRIEYSKTLVGNDRLGGTLGELWTTTGYRESCSGSSAAEVGHHYVSHAMIAAWSTDSGQFVGAAPEVEGDGGVNPTPPSPVPPAAPVLLESEN